MAKRANSARDPEPGLFDLPPEGAAAAPRVPPERMQDAPPEAPSARREPPRFTVAQLTEQIRARLAGVGRVRVEGELSSLRRPASGHLYFDLKDEAARLACVVWRSQVGRAVRFELEEGAQVVAHGRVDVYPPRGSYSLVVERLEPLGVGELLAQLEKLKSELRGLGWFERSRPLPRMPRCIGVVTSRDGAALRDVLRTRSLRWAGYPLRLCHTAVQGPGAAEEIAEAIERLDAAGVDVIVVCRGGGSLEDLWAFNERMVASAIWRTRVPVVSGVGHESDTTLADLVADHRAHTPTDAAQTVIPDRAAITDGLLRWGNYLVAAMDAQLAERTVRLRTLASRPALRDADWILGERLERLHGFATRLTLAARARHDKKRIALEDARRRLERQSPQAQLDRRRGRMARAGQRLSYHGERVVERASNRLALASKALESISPLRVLARGYSVTKKRGAALPLVDARDVRPGDELETRLQRGSIVSKVVSAETTESESEPEVDA